MHVYVFPTILFLSPPALMIFFTLKNTAVEVFILAHTSQYHRV